MQVAGPPWKNYPILDTDLHLSPPPPLPLATGQDCAGPGGARAPAAQAQPHQVHPQRSGGHLDGAVQHGSHPAPRAQAAAPAGAERRAGAGAAQGGEGVLGCTCFAGAQNLKCTVLCPSPAHASSTPLLRPPPPNLGTPTSCLLSSVCLLRCLQLPLCPNLSLFQPIVPPLPLPPTTRAAGR